LVSSLRNLFYGLMIERSCPARGYFSEKTVRVRAQRCFILRSNRCSKDT
jgi:hypothetical protein